MDRSEQELIVLERICQILGEGLELGNVFQRAITILREQLDIRQATLLIWDQASERLRIAAVEGLDHDEIDLDAFAADQEITGKVIASGELQIIPDIHPIDPQQHPSQTGGIPQSTDPPHVSCLCIPIKDGDRLIGAIKVHKPYIDNHSLHADARILTIIAGLIGQTIRINQLIQLEKDRWYEENRILRDNLLSRYRFDNIIGTSPAMLDVLATIGQVASSRATCLLLGETGCGKEMIAKAIHYNSPRSEQPLIRVNCGALSHQLLESELFGHVQGAFTGAVRDKIGRFEAANGGTIFLDEIGTLDPHTQVKLLRVLQEREFERVGDHQTIMIDVRIIAATNLNLDEEVRTGAFREDLYYRLNVVTINLPPLRSRREDIPLLIDHFLDHYNRENTRNLRGLSRQVLNTLLRYPWPGNVRELENTIERAVVLSTGEEFTEDLLPLQIRLFGQQTRSGHNEESISQLTEKLADQAVRTYRSQEGKVYNLVVDEVERQLLKAALKLSGGIKTRTADFLGINRNTLNKKVKILDCDPRTRLQTKIDVTP